MKYFSGKCLVSSLMLLVAAGGPSFAANEVAETPTGVGPDKGVVEASKAEGFRLSEKAVRGLGVRTTRPALATGSTFQVPAPALLSFQDEMGIYRFRNGRFKLIELKRTDVRPENGAKNFRITSAEIRVGDQVAVEGASLLRLTDLNIWGGDEGGE